MRDLEFVPLHVLNNIDEGSGSEDLIHTVVNKRSAQIGCRCLQEVLPRIRG